ncbi:alanyl-tRNA editing protein [Saccharolobus solfataricus]|uniref:Alanyl-tRNA editing protein AlaX-M n=3 Tax=Saccharolobus solfataricus TaxID=2287 RepID=ALAXM_SACS2|nr:alanyl-tRNA editing protein AlaXM [Saccharolobus solfataricus]Q97ZX2.1 RecName: Full=Alanyl-tRNA editing protein AlaX-M; Short=AlaX-M; AltName: Full=Alanyl-tRNA deacylase AlaX-M [Saccharolobus solfataricus P2]AAK40776.1 Alanyl-tRNA synthetase truncated homolog (alaS-like1) [Saccharolobus solfataricus P2]AKA73751.1 alanyl-tRNA editing protein [Saccharolobus solfataricus]AKA76448.1 alanyl-tRNA editing protein [Saccharolobus solfataricus]AKA79141.1 alanyl-tRNA editing protein [Saccharolobus so
MTEELYLKDSYIKEFEGRVVRIEGNYVILDKTAFYPGGGGLDNDTGFLVNEKGERISVTEVKRGENGEILHKIDQNGSLNVNEKVIGTIDWDRRYRMMRLHTASHIVAALAYRKFGALITGGHISPEQAKDDFNVENKDTLIELINEANEIIKKDIELKIYFLPREEALMIPAIVKLAGRNPPQIPIWRIVEIPGIDIQADGGPHVKNTKEIGEIVLLKVENKGKGRKRVYYTVKP